MKRGVIIVSIIILLAISLILLLKLNIFERTGTLKGEITLHLGDCMPTICMPGDCPPSTCFNGGVKVNISIRNLTMVNDSFPFFSRNDSKVIKMIESNESGDFMTILPAGNYSLFFEYIDSNEWRGSMSIENSTYNEYCNNMIPYGNLFLVCPIEIKNNQVTNYSLGVNAQTS